MRGELELLSVEAAAAQDAAALVEVQNAAFLEDFQRYGFCPGYGRTVDDMLRSIERARVFKLNAGGRLVGDAIVVDRGGGVFHLGGLCVIPAWQHRGIGQAALRFLLDRFPQARRWTLETPADKTRNLRFYERFGFRVAAAFLDGPVEVARLERPGAQAPRAG